MSAADHRLVRLSLSDSLDDLWNYALERCLED